MEERPAVIHRLLNGILEYENDCHTRYEIYQDITSCELRNLEDQVRRALLMFQGLTSY